MNKKLSYICLFLTLIAHNSINGQHFIFEHITTNDGLSQSTVNSIIQDHRGFIWFGTNDGLDKFDGYKIERFSHEKNTPGSLNKNTILTLYEDTEGIIWIGTYGGGINRFDYSLQEFTQFEHVPGDINSLSNNQVFEIFKDSEGIFWIGTEHGVDKFYKEKGRFESIDNQLNVPFGKTETITEDRLGDIWIASGNGIFRYSRLRKKFTRYQLFGISEDKYTGNFVWDVYVDRRGDLWVGSLKGLSKFDYTKNKFTDFVPDNFQNPPNNKFHIRNIYEDSQNNLWIGTDGHGLMIFDRKEQKFLHTSVNTESTNEFRGNVVTAICEDKTGNMWFGTFKNGVNKIDRLTKKFQSYRHIPNNPNSLKTSDIKAVYQDKAGMIWAGTEKGGLSRINPQSGKIKTYLHEPGNNKSLPNNVVLSVKEATNETLWIGTYSGGLSLFNKNTGDFSTIPEITDKANNKTSNVVWTTHPDISGKLWVGTWGAGLQLFDPETKTFENFNIVEEGVQSTNSVLSICRDYQGFFWVGTYGDGLKKINPLTREVYHFRHEDNVTSSLIDNVVQVVFEDHKRNLWVGTKDGLDLFDRKNETFSHYSTLDGLPNNVINGILQDDNHNLWISTNKGISRFNPDTEEFRNYNIHDGLQGNEFNKGVCYEAPNGDFLYGGVNGLNVFNPNEIKDNPYVPNVLLTGMKIKNEPVDFGSEKKILDKHISATSEITLPHNFSVLTFEFVALNLTKPEKNQYAFYLKNYDEGWRYVNNQRTATYTNLNPGEYEFVVKASNNDGLWNETGTSVKLVVTPPYWKTWWFRSIIVVLIWSGFTLLFMLRTRMIKRQKAELEVLVEKRTHELQLQKSAVESKNIELEKQKQEIVRQRDQVEEMTQKVHEADQMKLKFFTNISHEFRTPLTLILGPLEKLLNNGNIQKDIHHQLALIHRNTLRLLRLVNEIMDFRKIETGRMKLHVTKNDMAGFVHDIYFSFNDLAKRNQIDYVFKCGHENINGWFDRDKVEKIIFNLISNAFKFTPPGGEIIVEIDKDETGNDSGGQDSATNAVIKVIDNGRGISKEHLARIFDRFYQVESNTSPVWQGSGIGLSFIKNLVEIHYGNINVESEKWKGTTFTVTLPVSKEVFNKNEIIDSLYADENFIAPLRTISDIDENQLQQNIAHQQKSHKPSVLLIEDNADVRLYIREEINHDYQVLEAENGKEGLELANSNHIDLIVSDIMMPEMDGLELCKQIKTNLDTSHIPVILLTARTSDDYKLKGLEIGADDYVFKPFNATVLSARIKNLIESRKKLKQQFSRDLSLTPKDLTVTSPDEKFLTKTLEIVEKNMSDSEFNVDRMVEEIGMSRSVFYRKLKNLTGQSANDFIKIMRLKRAAQILRQNKLTISEVSYEVGFNDPQYFSKCFSKQFGITPSQFVAKSAAMN
ncbi:MAG: hybrid sensor histidine kinase/response regulator transcription factor [Tangfeifania sp.]